MRPAAASLEPIVFPSRLVVALVLILAATLGAAAFEASDKPSGSDAKEGKAKAGTGEATVKCPFCRSSVPASVWFCPRCGRLFRLKKIEPLGRFWGDAFYMVTFPPASDRLSITADITDSGLVHESTVLDSGERYAFDPVSRKGVVITGDAMAQGIPKAAPYHATVQASLDGEQRLVLREIVGSLTADPIRHLYRKIQYGYEGNLLNRIEVGTWLYPQEGDWKKRPAEWTHHELAQIAIVYTGGVLTRIETTLREGRKAAGGKVEYDARPPVVYEVNVADGYVVSIRRVQAGP